MPQVIREHRWCRSSESRKAFALRWSARRMDFERVGGSAKERVIRHKRPGTARLVLFFARTPIGVAAATFRG